MTSRSCLYGDECGPEEADCREFEQFGMACDECDSIGYRDAGGWEMNEDGSVVCEGGCSPDRNSN